LLLSLTRNPFHTESSANGDVCGFSAQVHPGALGFREVDKEPAEKAAEADAEKAAEADEEMVNGGTNEEEAGEVPTAADEEGSNIVSFGWVDDGSAAREREDAELEAAARRASSLLYGVDELLFIKPVQRAIGKRAREKETAGEAVAAAGPQKKHKNPAPSFGFFGLPRNPKVLEKTRKTRRFPSKAGP
jgi:hypothetical protein